MKTGILFSLSLIYVTSSMAQNQLDQIFSSLDSLEEAYSIDNPIWRGEHPETFPIYSYTNEVERVNASKKYLKQLKDLDTKTLDVQSRINREIRMLQLENDVNQTDHKLYLITINAEGGDFSSPTFFIPRLPFNNKGDYEAYINWLPSFVGHIRAEKEKLQMGMKEGVMAPKVIVENAIKLLNAWTGEQNAFYRPFDNFPEGVSASEQNELRKKGSEIIASEIIPAYQDLQDFLKTKYLKKAPTEVGISGIANGKRYYENRVRYFTTLDMTPDSVFNLGHAEVARIKALMNEIIKEVGFNGTFQEFIDFLRTDEQFYARTPEELLSRAAWLSKKAEGALPRLFSDLYDLPFTVEPVPDDIAPTYTGGRYVPGSRKYDRAGIYWVNTYNLKSRPFYTLPALSLHEAVPGHHLQMMAAEDVGEVPDFRQGYYISAFGEGWGLYSEYLGEEMGIYTTPYEWFGRYTYEMWRACRLVVDVGLHYKGWTREQAVKFMAENTALSLHEVNTEIDRYIGWPGQAVSYKVGELTIKRLRADAELKLGEKFDIQDFHQVVLRNGSVPLPILEEEVRRWVESIEMIKTNK